MLSLGPTLAFLIISLALWPVANYFVDKKGLRKYPSPSIAGLTSMWSWWHNKKTKRFMAIHHAHEKLGPIIRVEPNHLSFNIPEAIYDIYSHAASSVLKDVYYDAIAGEHRSSGNTRSREEHTRKRRTIAASFSPNGVAEYHPYILKATENLVSRLRNLQAQHAEEGFNLTPWIHMYTFDAISGLVFGNSFNFLENGNDECMAETIDGNQYKVNALTSFLDGVMFSSNMGYFGTSLAKWLKKNILFCTYGAKMAANFGNMSTYRIRLREKIPAEEAPRDIWSRIIAANQKPGGYVMPFGERIAESNSMLNAGNDTIGSSLTGLLYHLACNEAAQKKLQAEIDPLFQPDWDVCDHESVKNLPYLHACIDESLRERPPVGIGLPRITPPQGFTIAGKQIPGNTTVSVPTWSIHHNAELFPDPYTFKPERWFDEKQLPALKRFSLPFSTGGRACVGRNLAYYELELALTSIVHAFDIQLTEPNQKLDTLEWFNHSPGDLKLKLTPRSHVAL